MNNRMEECHYILHELRRNGPHFKPTQYRKSTFITQMNTNLLYERIHYRYL